MVNHKSGIAVFTCFRTRESMSIVPGCNRARDWTFKLYSNDTQKSDYERIYTGVEVYAIKKDIRQTVWKQHRKIEFIHTDIKKLRSGDGL